MCNYINKRERENYQGSPEDRKRQKEKYFKQSKYKHLYYKYSGIHANTQWETNLLL